MNELPIIQKAHDLTKWYVPILNSLPRNHEFGLGDRIVNGFYEVWKLILICRIDPPATAGGTDLPAITRPLLCRPFHGLDIYFALIPSIPLALHAGLHSGRPLTRTRVPMAFWLSGVVERMNNSCVNLFISLIIASASFR